MHTMQAVEHLIESKGKPLNAKDAVLAGLARTLAERIDAADEDRSLAAMSRELRSVVEQLAGPEVDEFDAFIGSLPSAVRDSSES